jgi:hypothetical protein
VSELWTAEEKTIVRKLYKQRNTVAIMAERTNKTQDQIRQFLRTDHRRKDYWSLEERNILKREVTGVHRKLTWKDCERIAALLPARTPSGVRNQITWLKLRANPLRVVEPVNIPEQIWDERDRRANEPRTLTMLLCGDPEPSRSALRQRVPAPTEAV